MRVLIAEHLSKVRFALRVTLERQRGLKSVSEVADAEELLSQAEVVHPDLVLLDCELPGMEAGQAMRSLARLSPHPFIIALSGKEAARQAALQAGADAFVCKADPPERLLAAIEEFCARKRGEDYVC